MCPYNPGKEINDTYPHRGFTSATADGKPLKNPVIVSGNDGFTSATADGKRAWMSVEGDLWELEF